MGITSLDIINDLSTIHSRLINIEDFDSEKLSIIRTKKIKCMFIMITIHFFYLLKIEKIILKNIMIINT